MEDEKNLESNENIEENNIDSDSENIEIIDNKENCECECDCDSKGEHDKKKNKHKEKIVELEKEVISLKDKLLRNAADLDNFKKRMNDERIKERRYASQSLVTDLVDILINFDKIVNVKYEDEKFNNFIFGFKMINNQIFDLLKKDGLEEIDANGKFDPNFHQAVSQGEDETKESNCILEVLSKGYKYKDRVIKPTMVIVNK